MDKPCDSGLHELRPLERHGGSGEGGGAHFGGATSLFPPFEEEFQVGLPTFENCPDHVEVCHAVWLGLDHAWGESEAVDLAMRTRPFSPNVRQGLNVVLALSSWQKRSVC